MQDPVEKARNRLNKARSIASARRVAEFISSKSGLDITAEWIEAFRQGRIDCPSFKRVQAVETLKTFRGEV